MQYDPTKRKFIDGNAYVSHLETRAAIDRLTEFIKRQSAKYAKAFNDGKMSPDEFNAAMRELLKASHIAASTVGRGGKDRMTSQDWLRVARKVKWQFGFLNKFTRKLKAGKPINVRARAAAYTNAIYISYAESFHIAQTENPKKGGGILARLILNAAESCAECAADAALDWQPVEELAELGTRLCSDWCKCDILFSDADGNEV